MHAYILHTYIHKYVHTCMPTHHLNTVGIVPFECIYECMAVYMFVYLYIQGVLYVQGNVIHILTVGLSTTGIKLKINSH